MKRRSYLFTLMSCLTGAGLALAAVTRTWSLHSTARTGMSDLRIARTGADLEPWVIGLALVALAGTGALLATRGVVRRLLGGMLALAGAGVLAGAIIGRAGLDPGRASLLWPIACALGGAIITLGGVTAARDGHRWPSMSTRYERGPVPPQRTDAAAESEPLAAAGLKPGPGTRTPSSAHIEPVDHRAAWDALDRGDDPTT
jgi:tryptophan-associated transmembrane protein